MQRKSHFFGGAAKVAFSRSQNKWFYERRRFSSSGTAPMPEEAGSLARSRDAADRLAVHGDSVDCQARVKKFIVPVGDAEQQEVAASGSNREAGTRPARGAAALSWAEEAGSGR